MNGKKLTTGILLLLPIIVFASGSACGSLFSVTTRTNSAAFPSDFIGRFTTPAETGKTETVEVFFYIDNGCVTPATAGPDLFDGCNDAAHASGTYGFSQLNTYKVIAGDVGDIGSIRCVKFTDGNAAGNTGLVNITCSDVTSRCTPQVPGESVTLATLTLSGVSC
ncbi:MAG: hypothetical protein A3E87_07925 [Gammaproteobacteria bacterium RIFCSPHIGHO2_12_FULL_35_23]|nr:MAG: hypothetical protein A3E87_07925 [Gammaproteobacteria bacterium RIFCSPHIGHO2_12_FULL_35_23]